MLPLRVENLTQRYVEISITASTASQFGLFSQVVSLPFLRPLCIPAHNLGWESF